jgi:hypothetical protein
MSTLFRHDDHAMLRGSLDRVFRDNSEAGFVEPLGVRAIDDRLGVGSVRRRSRR